LDGLNLPSLKTPVRTAVVLSGGEGVRLKPITNDTPKGLVKVAGKPLLQWVVEWLRKGGVSEIVIGVAYLKDQIIQFFRDGQEFGVNIRYSVHSVEGGTAEGFKLAITRHVRDPTFFALNGDQITDLDLGSMLRTHNETRPVATIGVMHPRLPFGLVEVDEKDYCSGFVEKPIVNTIFCSTGIYLFDQEILKYLPDRGDVEKTTFPRLSLERKLRAYRHLGSFVTVNSLRELEEAEANIGRNPKT
jgi:NDP-sugar pyrophosphorylase family protein